MLHLLETAALLVTAAAAFYGVWSVALRLGAAPPAGPAPNWVDCLAMLMAAAVPLAWEIGLRKVPLAEIGLCVPTGAARRAAASIGLVAAFAAYACVLFWLFRLRTLHLLSLENFGPFAATLLCVAVSEEALFRGVLQRRLTTVCGAGPAILMTACIFALVAHRAAPLAMNLAFRLPAGLLLGYLYHRHRSLIPPIALHWALNMAAAA